MTQRTRRRPLINSPGTRRLATHFQSLRRRTPLVDDNVRAIRRGDQRVLQALVIRTQGGDTDAATTAIWALLPRLAAVVIRRLPIDRWHEAIDDYLTFAYLVVLDVDTQEPPDHLADKIIARTRRRCERAAASERAVSWAPGLLEAVGPVDLDVEDRAIARTELSELIHAVREGLVTEHGWDSLLTIRFVQPTGTATDLQRAAAARARRRLREWRAEAA